jgi:copper chaperone
MSARTLQITGMSCGHCVQAVTRALEAVPGVRSVHVDLASRQAHVSGAADLAGLMAAVRAAGYEVQSSAE